MTLFQVEELCSYWSEHPPVHVLVAGFMGVKSEPRQARATARPELEPELTLPVTRVLAAVPGLDPSAADNLPSPIFDAAELMRMRL